MKTIDQIVAANIRERRVKLGLSQKALAEKAKLSPISLNKIEMGSRPAGKASVEAIAIALGCAVDDLYRGDLYESEVESPSNAALLNAMAEIEKENATLKVRIRLLESVANLNLSHIPDYVLKALAENHPPDPSGWDVVLAVLDREDLLARKSSKGNVS